MKGGYVLVNATGVDLNEASATVNGIYAKFINAIGTGKLIIVQNIVNDDLVLTPVPLFAVVDSGAVEFSIGGYSVSISDEDAVSVTAPE